MRTQIISVLRARLICLLPMADAISPSDDTRGEMLGLLLQRSTSLETFQWVGMYKAKGQHRPLEPQLSKSKLSLQNITIV